MFLVYFSWPNSLLSQTLSFFPSFFCSSWFLTLKKKKFGVNSRMNSESYVSNFHFATATCDWSVRKVKWKASHYRHWYSAILSPRCDSTGTLKIYIEISPSGAHLEAPQSQRCLSEDERLGGWGKKQRRWNERKPTTQEFRGGDKGKLLLLKLKTDGWILSLKKEEGLKSEKEERSSELSCPLLYLKSAFF